MALYYRNIENDTIVRVPDARRRLYDSKPDYEETTLLEWVGQFIGMNINWSMFPEVNKTVLDKANKEAKPKPKKYDKRRNAKNTTPDSSGESEIVSK